MAATTAVTMHDIGATSQLQATNLKGEKMLLKPAMSGVADRG